MMLLDEITLQIQSSNAIFFRTKILCVYKWLAIMLNQIHAACTYRKVLTVPHEYYMYVVPAWFVHLFLSRGSSSSHMYSVVVSPLLLGVLDYLMLSLCTGTWCWYSW